MFQSSFRLRSACARRRGVAAVEFAVCAPLVVMLVFAAIEASNMIFLKLDLQTAAYEAARAAAIPGGNATNSINRGLEVLRQRTVRGGSLQISPNNFSGVPIGGWITVTATAPTSQNRIIGRWFFNAGTLQARCVMVREGAGGA